MHAEIKKQAIELMKNHGKTEVYVVGDKFYFSHRNAKVQAGGDEELIETLTLESKEDKKAEAKAKAEAEKK